MNQAAVIVASSGFSRSRALRERVILWACLLYVLTSLLTGPLRWGLGQAGLASLIYVPNVMIMGAIAWQFVTEPRDEGFTPMRLIAVVVIGQALIVGLLFLPPVQVGFGVYTLLPFWFGLACSPILLRHWPEVARLAPWLWLIAAGGILINAAIDLPWEGFGYSVGDLDIEASREWSETGGGKRLAGLARSSFDAGIQIQLLAIVSVLHLRSTWLRLAIWIVSALAIWLTTSKGVLNVFAVLTPVVLLRHYLPQFPLRLLPLAFGIIGLLLPISTLLFTLQSNINDAALANLLFSFYDRMNNMWPEAWKLIFMHGNAFLGRGFGGVGTAQSYFEPDFFNAGDNLYMYWFVIYGWIALPGFLLLLMRTLRLQPFRCAGEFVVYCLVLGTVVYGLTTNVVENAMFAIVCGLCVRFLAAPIDLRPRNPEVTHVQA